MSIPRSEDPQHEPTQTVKEEVKRPVWAYNKYRATLTKNGKRFALVTPDGRDALSDEKAFELLSALNT